MEVKICKWLLVLMLATCAPPFCLGGLLFDDSSPNPETAAPTEPPEPVIVAIPSALPEEDCELSEPIQEEISALKDKVARLLAALTQHFGDEFQVGAPSNQPQAESSPAEQPPSPDPCADVECDVLPCPEDLQHTYPGNCCPECPQDWGLDPCVLSGTFEMQPTAVVVDPCADVECDVLPCPEDLQHTYPGNCCPECPQDWGVDPCVLSGTCEMQPTAVVVDPCANVECDELPCPEDVQYTPFGCCPQCPADWGVPPCVLRGDCTSMPPTPAVTSDPCADVECDVLPCPEDLQHTYLGNCCPECPQDWGVDPCVLRGDCTLMPPTPAEHQVPATPAGISAIGFPTHIEVQWFPPENQNIFIRGYLLGYGKNIPDIFVATLGPKTFRHVIENVEPNAKYVLRLRAFNGAGEGAAIYESVTTRPDPCADVECDVLPCPEDLQHTYPGNCCPECPQDWGLDPCELSGTCEMQPTAVVVVPDRCIRPCALIYSPVCGSDGKTYSNECVFETAMCKNSELTSMPGSCPVDESDPDSCPKPCPRIYRPVCGSDGNTYDNECLFEIEECKNPELTSEPGACSGKPRVEDSCADVECGVLPCPEDVQHTYPGTCCPECPQDWGVDPCELSGTCGMQPTLVVGEDPCVDVECDELPCPEDVQYTPFGCCPECPQDWGLDPCHFSGTCTFGPTAAIDPCADVECDVLPCPEDLHYTYPGNCCPECPQDWGLDPCHFSGTCTFGPTAAIDPGSCGKPCPRIYRPVCGSDGNTYGNECLFEIEECKNPELTSEPGACSGKPRVEDPCADVECDVLPCPEDLQHTYPGNCCPECPQDWGVDPCELSGTCGMQPTLVVVDDPCVDVECDELPCPEDVQYTPFGCCPECPQDWGLDPCHFSGTCTFGPTAAIDPDSCGKPCPRIYRPVCGSDGNTYNNECLFEIEECKNPVLTSEPGACSGKPRVEDPCADVECDELPCPEDVQYTPFGCCPQCPADWGIDPCDLGGGCETAGLTLPPLPDPCADVECDVLPCPEDLQRTYHGNCCPECPQDWGLDPCELSGTCNFGPTAAIEVLPPTSCSDITSLESGVYDIFPTEGGDAVSVFCDFDTAHGPWIVIQRRHDGSVNFYRTMADYQKGFGHLEGEFWFGLDKIYSFVSQGSYQLRIDLRSGSGISKFATFDDFSISDQSDGYRLSIGRFSGTARNSLHYHNGMNFTTRDVDNDLNSNKNCAKFYKGAWWYKKCLRSNLNGRYRDPARKHPDGLIWANWRGYTESMSFVEMKIRRVL